MSSCDVTARRHKLNKKEPCINLNNHPGLCTAALVSEGCVRTIHAFVKVLICKSPMKTTEPCEFVFVRRKE